MTGVFIIICALFVIYSYKIYNKIFNPIMLYSIIWVFLVIAYQIKLIKYYDLTVKTWGVIILSYVLLTFGMLFGNLIKVKPKNGGSQELTKYELKKYIIILSLISICAIIPNTIALIHRYGFNVLQQTVQIYMDSLTDQGIEVIPYLGYFAQAAVIFSGMFVGLYGFNVLCIIPIILAILNILPSGSRGNLIITILFFAFSYFLMKKKIKINKRYIVGFLVAMIGPIMIFSMLTSNRSSSMSWNSGFMSPLMIKITNISPSFYKNYEYITSNLGVLNEFVKNPRFSFGENTFGTFYNILQKIGSDIQYKRYQDFYYIPIRTNTGTWLRELIIDFDFLGMFLVVFFFGVIVGYLWKKCIKGGSLIEYYYLVILCTLIAMSFFVWYVREGSMMVVIVVGIGMIPICRKKILKIKHNKI